MRFLRFLLLFIMMAVLVPSSHGEMYKWVDEKGTVHFTDDLSSIPEKYRQDAETRKPSKEGSVPQTPVKPKPPPSQKVPNRRGWLLTFFGNTNCC